MNYEEMITVTLAIWLHHRPRVEFVKRRDWPNHATRETGTVVGWLSPAYAFIQSTGGAVRSTVYYTDIK